MPCPPLIKRCYAIIIIIEKGGKNMPRKHFELNSDVNKLIEKYDEINNVDFNKLVNKALRFYLVNQMNYKDVQDALNKADNEASKYIDEAMRSSMGDINRNY